MEKEYTLFVDGLSNNMNSNRLKNLFNSIGEIVDVYISFKKRRFSDFIFGFVRFRYEDDAKKAISTFDGKVVNYNRLKVRWAKHRRVGNGFQSTKVLPTQLNENIKSLLNACFKEHLGSFKEDLLCHVQKSLLSTLESVMGKISRDIRSSLAIESKDRSTDLDAVVVEPSVICGGVASNLSNLEVLPNGGSNVVKNKVHKEFDGNVGGNLGSELESEAESILSVEIKVRNSPMVPSYYVHSFSKSKKKKKKGRNKRNQKHNFVDNCFALEEEWWSDQVFSPSEDEDLIQKEISSLISCKGYPDVEVEEVPSLESVEDDKSSDEGISNHRLDPTLKLKNKKNKIFPTSKRLANTMSPFIIRPRFLKFALGVCKKSRKKFSRKDTVKYVIDNPPNSKARSLVLKPV